MSNTGSESQAAVVPSPTGGTTAFSDVSAFSAAYDRRLTAIRAVKDDELVALNIDVHAAVTTVLGALPEIKALAEGMSALPGLDQQLVAGLEDFAQAAGEANSRYVTATTPGEDIVAMNDAAMKMRETLRSDATALANRGLVDRGRLASFKGLIGYKNVAFELIDYANLMRDCWGAIQGKTALSAEEIQNAKQLGEQLVRAAGQREQGPAIVAETARIRQQALTLLVNSYDEARRAVVFLRWHADDADTIAPSLYAGRTRKKDDAAPVVTPPAPVPPAPVPPVVGATNGQAAAPVATGHPGASPFGG